MKILVRNLDRGVTDAEVLDLFKAYGAVESCVVVKDAATGKSKGFGFVEIEGQDEDIFIPESDTGTAMHQDKVFSCLQL